MIVYILMIIISLIFAYVTTKIENKLIKCIVYFLSMIPFFVVSALRYDVGTDYFYRYVPNYLTFANGGEVKSLEFLFKILIKICVYFSKDYVILFVITSAIIIGLIMRTIGKNSKKIVLSVSIFFVGSFFFQSLNLVRQFIAMSIIFSSYNLLLTDKIKDKILWLFCIVIATLFHSMSAVFLIMIFFNKKTIKWQMVLVTSIILMFFGGKIPLLIADLITKFGLTNFTNIDKYIHYTKYAGDLPLSTIIVETIIYIYTYLLYINAKRKGVEIEKEAIFFVNVQSIAIMSTIMNIHIELFFRFTLLFSIFQILSIPYWVTLNKDGYLYLFRYKIKKGISVLTALVIILMATRMIYSNIIKGADEVVPYKTIFTRSV